MGYYYSKLQGGEEKFRVFEWLECRNQSLCRQSDWILGQETERAFIDQEHYFYQQLLYDPLAPLNIHKWDINGERMWQLYLSILIETKINPPAFEICPNLLAFRALCSRSFLESTRACFAYERLTDSPTRTTAITRAKHGHFCNCPFRAWHCFGRVGQWSNMPLCLINWDDGRTNCFTFEISP